ncbi:velvet factor-domain-containing protein [Mycena filopes]|nr:velvet factor-domain-containing protein [Mycena filopes]
MISSAVIPDSLRHELIIRQMPFQARMSAMKGQERRVLDPVPAIELQLYDDNKRQVEVLLHEGLTGYMMTATLVDATTQNEIENVGKRAKTPALCGVFLSAIFPVRYPDSEATTLFFAFPDLAIRALGKFRLRFTLSVIGPDGCPTLMSVCSEPFTVTTAGNYGGVQNSTELTRLLARYGVHARIRNKARGAHPKHRPNPRRCTSRSHTRGHISANPVESAEETDAGSQSSASPLPPYSPRELNEPSAFCSLPNSDRPVGTLASEGPMWSLSRRDRGLFDAGWSAWHRHEQLHHQPPPDAVAIFLARATHHYCPAPTLDLSPVSAVVAGGGSSGADAAFLEDWYDMERSLDGDWLL